MVKEFSIKIKKGNAISIRSILLLFWTVFSTIVYGITSLLVRIFSRKASFRVAYWWALHIAFFSGIKIHTKNQEKLDSNAQYIFLANHQSIIDIIVLYLILPHKLSFIAKKSLFRIPLFGWCLAAQGHIAIDRSNPQKAKKSIDKASLFIREKNRSIIAFPEGTRSDTGKLGEFKLGIFSLAITTGIDIVPISINGTREIVPKNSYFVCPGNVEIIFHDPINIKEYNKSSKAQLAQKTWEIIRGGLQQQEG